MIFLYSWPSASVHLQCYFTISAATAIAVVTGKSAITFDDTIRQNMFSVR